MSPEELRQSLESAGMRVPLSGLLTRAQTATILGKSVGTLIAWQRAGLPPACVRIGVSWHYSIASIADLISTGS
jgi:hypothetical protein